MSDWQQLRDELQQWQQPLHFWWRDDDACDDTPALRQLLQLAQQFQVPVHLATIPERLQPGLHQLIGNTPAPCYILQHGIGHQNNACEGQRKIELGGQLASEQAIRDLSRGRAVLQEAFSEHYLDMLVPPWNRIDPALLKHLAEIGYQRLSVLGPRQSNAPLTELNVHLDIINWKQRRFAGEAPLLQQIINDLRAKRLGEQDPEEPYGVMTHHLDHDQACWAFLQKLFACLADFPALHWIGGPPLLENDDCPKLTKGCM